MATWKTQSCPVCGLRYSTFRAPDQLDWVEAYQELRIEHDDRILDKNDYSRPPNRRAAILGRMHQHKRTYWEEHVRICEEALD